MPDTDLAAYLDAVAPLHGLSLTREQRAAALLNLERFAAIAASFVDLPLAADDEPILVQRL
jgi:hypothetical protein